MSFNASSIETWLAIHVKDADEAYSKELWVIFLCTRSYCEFLEFRQDPSKIPKTFSSSLDPSFFRK